MIRALCQQNRVYLLLLLLLVSVSCSSNVRREIEDAVAAGEASDVEDLIVQGADPNRVYGGKSLLLRAAELGHTGRDPGPGGRGRRHGLDGLGRQDGPDACRREGAHRGRGRPPGTGRAAEWREPARRAAAGFGSRRGTDGDGGFPSAEGG